MKKTVRIIAVALIAVVALSSCSLLDYVSIYSLDEVVPKYESEDQFHTVLVGAVEITERETGKKITLTGNDILSVYYNLMGVSCERSKGIADGLTEKYSIKFIMNDDSASTVLYIIDESEYVYSGYTYKALSGHVELSYFELMFSR